MAHATLVSGLGFFDVGQQQVGGFTRLHAGRRFRLGTGLGEFLRVECCLGDDEKGFDVVRALPFQPLGALQPVERGIAAAGPDIGLADLRMRRRFPGLFEDRGGLAHAAFAEQRLCGNEGGRNEIGGKLQRLQGVVAGTRRVAFQLLGGARRQEDGVQTVGFGLFDDAGGLLLFEQADRIIPAA